MQKVNIATWLLLWPITYLPRGITWHLRRLRCAAHRLKTVEDELTHYTCKWKGPRFLNYWRSWRMYYFAIYIESVPMRPPIESTVFQDVLRWVGWRGPHVRYAPAASSYPLGGIKWRGDYRDSCPVAQPTMDPCWQTSSSPLQPFIGNEGRVVVNPQIWS